MSRARQAAALLAIGALASLAGFSGAAWLFGSGAPAPASSAALPAALPDEALLEPPPR